MRHTKVIKLTSWFCLLCFCVSLYIPPAFGQTVNIEDTPSLTELAPDTENQLKSGESKESQESQESQMPTVYNLSTMHAGSTVSYGTYDNGVVTVTGLNEKGLFRTVEEICQAANVTLASVTKIVAETNAVIDEQVEKILSVYLLARDCGNLEDLDLSNMTYAGKKDDATNVYKNSWTYFCNHTNLKNAKLPFLKDDWTMTEGAFNGTTRLESLSIRADDLQMNSVLMRDNIALKQLDIDAKKLAINSSIVNCNVLPTITILADELTIANGIIGCSGLTQLTIPAHTTINDSPYNNATSFSESSSIEKIVLTCSAEEYDRLGYSDAAEHLQIKQLIDTIIANSGVEAGLVKVYLKKPDGATKKIYPEFRPEAQKTKGQTLQGSIEAMFAGESDITLGDITQLNISCDTDAPLTIDDITYLREEVLKQNSNIKKVDLSNAVLLQDATVKEISEGGYLSGEYKTSHVLPAGAFKDCIDLQEIELPTSTTYIGQQAFAGSGLSKFSLESDPAKEAPYRLSVMPGAFENCKELTTVKIGSTYNSFFDINVFVNCDKLTEISLKANTSMYVSRGLLENCKQLVNVEIQSRNLSFYVDQYNSLKVINQCPGLESVSMLCTAAAQNNPRSGFDATWAKGVIYDCPKLTNITVSADIMTYTRSNQRSGMNLMSVSYDESLVENCPNIKNVSLSYVDNANPTPEQWRAVALDLILLPAGADWSEVTFSQKQGISGGVETITGVPWGVSEALTIDPSVEPKSGSLADRLAEHRKVSTDYKTLTIAGLNLTSEAFTEMQKFSKLETLDLSEAKVDSSNSTTNNGFTGIHIPENTEGGFTHLKTLILPKKNTVNVIINQGAFNNTQLQTLDFSNIELDQNKGGLTILNGAFSDNHQLEKLIIGPIPYVTFDKPSPLTIQQGAFNNCENLKVLQFTKEALEGEVINGIRPRASEINDAMPNLYTFELASGITTIPNDAQRLCTKLQHIDLTNIKSIGGEAFNGCINLELSLLKEMDSIGISAFRNCTSIEELTLKDIQKIEGYAFQGCTGLKVLTLDGTNAIGDQAFAGTRVSTGEVTPIILDKLIVTNVPENMTIGQSVFKDSAINSVVFKGLDTHTKNIVKLFDGSGVSTTNLTIQQTEEIAANLLTGFPVGSDNFLSLEDIKIVRAGAFGRTITPGRIALSPGIQIEAGAFEFLPVANEDGGLGLERVYFVYPGKSEAELNQIAKNDQKALYERWQALAANMIPSGNARTRGISLYTEPALPKLYLANSYDLSEASFSVEITAQATDPDPIPTPTPTPDPEPTPEPKPDPDPVPTPDPEPAPAPNDKLLPIVYAPIAPYAITLNGEGLRTVYPAGSYLLNAEYGYANGDWLNYQLVTTVYPKEQEKAAAQNKAKAAQASSTTKSPEPTVTTSPWRQMDWGGAVIDLPANSQMVIRLQAENEYNMVSEVVEAIMTTDNKLPVNSYEALIQSAYTKLYQSTPSVIWQAAYDYPITAEKVTINGLMALYDGVYASGAYDKLSKTAQKQLNWLMEKAMQGFAQVAEGIALDSDLQHRQALVALAAQMPLLKQYQLGNQSLVTEVLTLAQSLQRVEAMEETIKTAPEPAGAVWVEYVLAVEQLGALERQAMLPEVTMHWQMMLSRSVDTLLSQPMLALDRSGDGRIVDDVSLTDRDDVAGLLKDETFAPLVGRTVMLRFDDGREEQLDERLGAIKAQLGEAQERLGKMAEIKELIDTLPDLDRLLPEQVLR